MCSSLKHSMTLCSHSRFHMLFYGGMRVWPFPVVCACHAIVWQALKTNDDSGAGEFICPFPFLSSPSLSPTFVSNSDFGHGGMGIFVVV